MRRLSRQIFYALISPVAIGAYITCAAIALTLPYYDLASETDPAELSGKRVGLVDLIYTAHLKSIDYRLRARGPRPVSPNLALVAIDERAVGALGRWPWPRPVLAKAVERLFQDGAKLLAFDMSFAERSQNPAAVILDRLHDSKRHDWYQALLGLEPKLDLDQPLGQVFAKYADRIVAGAFFRDAHEDAPTWTPETDFCRDLIFRRTPAARQWDREEVLLSVIDPFRPPLPASLSTIYGGILETTATELKKRYGASEDLNEQLLFDLKLNSALHEACGNILEDYRGEIAPRWNELVRAHENPRDFKFTSYDAWLTDFREKSKRSSIPYTDAWELNTPTIARGIKHTGFFNTEQDSDGVIRRKGLVVRSGLTLFPSLSLKAYLVSQGYNATVRMGWNAATGTKDIRQIEITDNETGDHLTDVPVDGQGRQLLNYAGPREMFPTLSFADVLSDAPEATIEQRVFDPKHGRYTLEHRTVRKRDFIKDKIFVVGATATGIFDMRVTPFEENYPGAETHLNAIDNMLQRNSLTSPSRERAYMALALGVLGTTLSVALAFLGALSGLALTLATLGSTVFIDQHYLFSQGLVVSLIWPLILTSVIYVALTSYRYLTEERGKLVLLQTFSKYVSPAIVNEILSHPDNVELGGRKAHLTVFFSDVRGFTTIAEKLDPRALSDLLNSYLTPMTELVFRHRGTLDKYMGDAIMAFFGAPLALPDHPAHACRCALESLTKLRELKAEYERRGLPEIDIAIGLSTGEVSVGNMGSQTVRSYTVMGDTVNLASRLEAINREYGTHIILSEMTYAEVKDTFVCREVDRVRVKGKVQPVRIYELLAEGELDAKRSQTLALYRAGLDAYHRRAFAEGLKLFSEVLALAADDSVARVYLDRCQALLDDPPAADWDGVVVMKTK